MKLYAFYESYFKSKNDYKLAYKYGAKSDSIHNNILSKEKLTYISKMERARIENTARNRVDELLTIQSTKDKIIGKERMYKYIFAFIAGLILIASIWIWRLYRTRNNYAIKLTTSNEELQQSLDENRVLVKKFIIESRTIFKSSLPYLIFKDVSKKMKLLLKLLIRERKEFYQSPYYINHYIRTKILAVLK